MANRSITDVQDILYEVFLYLNPDHYTYQEEIARARKTLLHSALTCRNFARPALDVLWNCLPSEKPLLELLWTLGIVLEVETDISASGPIYVGFLRLHHNHNLLMRIRSRPILTEAIRVPIHDGSVSRNIPCKCAQ